jgi:multiple sugar transport system permease protein
LDKLLPLLWIGGIILLYGAIGFWIVTVRDALRRGTIAAAALPLVLAAAALAGMAFDIGSAPVRLITVSAISIVVLAVYYVLAPSAKPKYVKIRRADSRQSYLHLVLLTGTVIFIVPFVWLVSTSLKDDEDIFTNEIRIIPQRPVKWQFAGYSEPLELVTVEGSKAVESQMTLGQVTDNAKDRDPVWVKVKDNEDTISVAPAFKGPKMGAIIPVNPDLVKKVKRTGAVWENYPESLQYLPEETHYGLVYLGNTLTITVLSILGTLLTASMVAFSFARLRWPGKDGLFVLLLSTMMLPYAVTMIPQFLIWQRLGFINTLVPLWAGAFFGGGAFNIFLLRQFFMTIPSELEEAAKIDGCSYWRTFWTIMMPLVRPALATVAIMTFMGSWNNFMGPLIYISTPTRMPLAYALQLYQSVHGGEHAYLMAASTMVMIPVLLVFFFCQRYFIQGITLTGLKG